MLQEGAMWNRIKKKRNMGFIDIYNNPLNTKFHISFASVYHNLDSQLSILTLTPYPPLEHLNPWNMTLSYHTLANRSIQTVVSQSRFNRSF